MLSEKNNINTILVRSFQATHMDTQKHKEALILLLQNFVARESEFQNKVCNVLSDRDFMWEWAKTIVFESGEMLLFVQSTIIQMMAQIDSIVAAKMLKPKRRAANGPRLTKEPESNKVRRKEMMMANKILGIVTRVGDLVVRVIDVLQLMFVTLEDVLHGGRLNAGTNAIVSSMDVVFNMGQGIVESGHYMYVKETVTRFSMDWPSSSTRVFDVFGSFGKLLHRYQLEKVGPLLQCAAYLTVDEYAKAVNTTCNELKEPFHNMFVMVKPNLVSVLVQVFCTKIKRTRGPSHSKCP